MGPIVEVNHLEKIYKVYVRPEGFRGALQGLFKREVRYVEALKNLDFQLFPGEKVALLGPNGAGKSTCIKILSGILLPSSGDCRVLGYVPWKERRKLAHHIGVIFGQKSALWWDLPVSESFMVLKAIYKIDSQKAQKRLNILKEVLNIGDFFSTPVRQLSLGQRMRCEMAAALLHDPQLLFLDEPTIGMDVVTKLAFREFLLKCNQEFKTTLILTTHDVDDIAQICSERILSIGKGKIYFDDSFERLKEKFPEESHDTEKLFAKLFQSSEV